MSSLLIKKVENKKYNRINILIVNTWLWILFIIINFLLLLGVGMTLTNYENQLVYSLLRGSEYTYS